MPIGKKGSKPTKKITKAPAKKAAPAAPKYIPKLASDPGVEAINRMSVNLVAIPGGGKTGAALSYSKNWKGMRRSTLEDIIHVGWDETPLVGFSAAGIRVPYHFDVAQIMVKKQCTIADAMLYVADEAYEICDKVGGIEGYIDDTISMLSLFLEAELGIETEEAKGLEGPKLYGTMKSLFMQYRVSLLGLPGSPMRIACFHLAPPPLDIPNRKDPKDKEKKKAVEYTQQGEGKALLTPLCVRSIKHFFFGAASVEAFCRSYRGTKGEWRYELRLDDFKDTRSKNRFRDIVDGPQESNLRVLVDKIKKGKKR